VAEFNLEYSTITAPEKGKILKKFAEENELISAGIPVFLFGGTGEQWIVRVGVIDREVVRLHLGDSADVSFDAYRGVTFPAIVSEISEFADPMNGTYEVELRVDSSGYRLVSGLVAKVVIRPEEKRSYYIVPVEALVEAEGWRGFVYSIDPGGETVTKRAVRIDLLLGDEIAIRAGIEDIGRVVTEGAPYLTDGARVAVLEE
jgi:RND family efflux transporter MFP subunit